VLITAGGLAAIWLTRATATSGPLLKPETFLRQFEFQRSSLLLARDYPLIGAGLDQFQMLYSTYVLLIHVGFMPHSHSLFLNVAIEQGLPGLLALIWIGGLLAVVVWRRVLWPKTTPATTADSTPVGIVALSLVVILVHGTVDNALQGPGALFLFVPLAFAVPDVQEQQQSARQRRVLSVLLVGLPLALALLWPRGFLSLVYSNLGAVHQSRAELSVYEWPTWPIQDAVRLKVDLSRSISEFERALALEPGNPTANRRLGMIELSLGEYEAALGHLEAAYTVEPENVTTRQLLGEALVANGRVDEGKALWSTVSNEQRQLEMRAFWYSYIGDTERELWVRQAIDSP
jgi:hypothetical protein